MSLPNDRPQNQNLATDIIGNRYISTALVYRSSPWMDNVKTYETYIWEYDHSLPDGTDKRGRWLHEKYYNSEAEALKIHGKIVASLRKKFSEV